MNWILCMQQVGGEWKVYKHNRIIINIFVIWILKEFLSFLVGSLGLIWFLPKTFSFKLINANKSVIKLYGNRYKGQIPSSHVTLQAALRNGTKNMEKLFWQNPEALFQFHNGVNYHFAIVLSLFFVCMDVDIK